MNDSKNTGFNASLTGQGILPPRSLNSNHENNVTNNNQTPALATTSTTNITSPNSSSSSKPNLVEQRVNQEEQQTAAPIYQYIPGKGFVPMMAHSVSSTKKCTCADCSRHGYEANSNVNVNPNFNVPCWEVKRKFTKMHGND